MANQYNKWRSPTEIQKILREEYEFFHDVCGMSDKEVAKLLGHSNDVTYMLKRVGRYKEHGPSGDV